MADRKPWRIADAALGDLEGDRPKVAVLPFGATEPHGRHLPYGTDTYQVAAIADHAAELASAQGARVAVLPAIPFGVQTTQQSYPFAMNLYPSTLGLILSNLAESLEASGVTRAIILNGHGGNDFYPWIKESYGKHGVYFVQVSWFDIRTDLAEELFAGGGDHANELETSFVLHLRPDLVDMAQAGDQRVATPRLKALREGWARAPRPWERYTKDSGAGDPRAATAEKGRQHFDAVCQSLAEFFVELDRAELDERFPF